MLKYMTVRLLFIKILSRFQGIRILISASFSLKHPVLYNMVILAMGVSGLCVSLRRFNSLSHGELGVNVGGCGYIG